MLSYCLVGLVSYCSNASGTKWYVDDSPHLVKNIFNIFSNKTHPCFTSCVIGKASIPSFLRFNIFSKIWFSIYFSRTGKMGENGQYFTQDSKVRVGQDRRFRKSSLGCDDIWVAIDWVTCRFFRAHVSKRA